MTRQKLRWVLVSPNGQEVRTGLSFGTFDEATAYRRAVTIARPQSGFALRVFVDGREVEAQHDAAGSS